MRTAVHEHLRVADTAAGGYRDLATIQGLETERKLRDEYPPGEYIVWLEPFRQEVACDPTRDEYHSPQVAELLEQGMFINEVRALLGRPHGTTFAILNGVGVRCNTYTAYTLDDGRVLLLRFIQASVKDYSQEELERRVPNFNERDWEVRLILEDTGIGWFKLQEVQILTLEEYLGTRYVSVGTPEEELPEEYKNGGGTIRPRSSDTTIH